MVTIESSISNVCSQMEEMSVVFMKDIIVYGRGVYWKRKKDTIMRDYNVVAFIDSHIKDRACVMQDDIPVYSPAYAVTANLEIYIMVTNRYMNEMIHTLQDLGVSEGRIKTGLLIEPSFNVAEKLLVELGSEIRILPSGIEINCSKGTFIFNDADKFRSIMRRLLSDKDPFIKHLIRMPVKPFSRQFGNETGKPIDRYYIENFLDDHKHFIHGDVMEIANHTYTYQFGHDIRHAFALHINGWGDENTVIGNLVTGEGIQENFVDCFICTQTLQMIYNIHNVVKNIYKALKPRGTLLLTGSGISQLSMNDYDNWGEFWRFTEKSMRKLMEEYFGQANVHVQAYGNVKTSICFLYGVCQEELEEEDFKYNDEQYPLIVTAVCKKA